jgi:ABC-type transporter Mla subunit MlaD
VFVSIALIIGTAVVMTIGEVWVFFEAKTGFAAEFPVAEGVQNIKAGGEVRVGGVKLGRVTGVRPMYADEGRYENIQIDFVVHSDVELYEGTQVFVRAPVIGAGAWLEITDVGDPAASRLAEGTVIPGSISGGQMEAFLGKDVMDFLGSLESKYQGDLKPILDNANDATANVKALTERVQGDDWPRWAGQVDEVMTWATGFTETLDGAVADAEGLLSDSRALIADNRPGIDETVENARVTSENFKEMSVRAKEETMQQVEDLLTSGQGAMDEAVAAIERVRADYEAWEVQFAETLGSANLASQQLKFAMIEVRRSPWKVLYRPDSTELEHEMLYEAARSFALAVADVKAAAQSMQRVLDRHGDELRDDPELMQRVKDNLLEPLDRYETAQERLFDVLINEGGP